MDRMLPHQPQRVNTGLGEAILWLLGQGLEVGEKYTLNWDNVSMGEKPDVIPLGDWKVTIERVRSA